MPRRTKEDIHKMNDIASSYLDRATGPHDAWNLFVKEHLIQGKALPPYVSGISDFIKIYDKRNSVA